ncbi:MAG: endo-1,4-beta-xylanase [Paludibacter sp.]
MAQMRFYTTNVLLIVFTICFAGCKTKTEPGLKDALKGKFLMGVAMNSQQITGKDTLGNELILKNFNSVVAENCMKSEVIQPVEGEFDFSLADQFVDFGIRHNMFIIGHTLIWHSQAPKWFFTNENGQPVSREILIERMHKHIFTVVKRYKGRVNGWDVVNEAIEDDGSWRKTPFYNIIGEEYIQLAFQFAKEADPQAELYYNDYNMAKPGKRATVVKLIENLTLKGIKVHGIGMQGHLMMDFPAVEDFEKSIIAFGATGAKVMITEMDLSVLPNPYSKMGAEISLKADYQERMNPYKNELPDSAKAEWENRFLSFFRVFIKHQNIISRVTLWGLTDNDSWKNDWPIKGRTDYPLLFNRNYQPKAIITKIINLKQ